jgi:hypothetical protein
VLVVAVLVFHPKFYSTIVTWYGCQFAASQCYFEEFWFLLKHGRRRFPCRACMEHIYSHILPMSSGFTRQRLLKKVLDQTFKARTFLFIVRSLSSSPRFHCYSRDGANRLSVHDKCC